MKSNKEIFELKSDPRVADVFEAYPETVKAKMKELRTLVLESAQEIDGLTSLEETLKWGEPSYIAKKGSTLRMDWKSKNPEQVAMYFKCTSQLVPTFKMVFGNKFKYENNRAIFFGLKEEIPHKELKQCIKATLCYHSLKKKPLLGL